MPYKEKEIEKLYYSIGEVAKMFEVNTSHIRFWSKEFDVIKPATNKKGNRLYTKADLDNLKKIYHLVKEKGFTLRGAKVELKEERKRDREQHVLPPQQYTIASTPPVISNGNGETLLFEETESTMVDNIAVMNSLRKMRASLLDVHKELSVLEVH
jgi:DNA-binding transcriptional MerR regulator